MNGSGNFAIRVIYLQEDNMTKKQNRRARRILNNNMEFNMPISGHKMNKIKYGCGLAVQDIKLKYNEE